MPVPQSMCAQIGLQMTMEIAVYLFIGLSMAYWLVLMRIDDMKQTHYWRGRKDGFDMHRRDRSMVTLTQTIKGSVNSGRHTSTIQLRLVKSHYVWRSSRFLGLLNLQATVTRSSTHLLTFRYTRQSSKQRPTSILPGGMTNGI